jgi:hypothetical protein
MLNVELGYVAAYTLSTALVDVELKVASMVLHFCKVCLSNTGKNHAFRYPIKQDGGFSQK